ncbi:MAG: protein-export chaperone SecB [Candidatus Cloacimonetes bacterium]|nr:protein-export chaperone SecB [Candidatus Cloacimonadota bacterium]
MNTENQPGIICDSVLLLDTTFWRSPDFPEVPHNSISFNSDVQYSTDAPNTGAVILSCAMFVHDGNEKGKTHAEFKCNYVGLFKTEENKENLQLKEFLDKYAPAILLPYVRELLSSTFARAGLPPFVLPPVNVLAMINKETTSDTTED